MADMIAKQEQLSSSYRTHRRRVTQQCVCWRACAVRESRSAVRLYRIDSAGVVSVGEMSHKVKLE